MRRKQTGFWLFILPALFAFVLVVLVCVCLAALLCLTVYLLSAAGRRPDQEGIFLNPLDRVPGDLYLVILGASLTGQIGRAHV